MERLSSICRRRRHEAHITAIPSVRTLRETFNAGTRTRLVMDPNVLASPRIAETVLYGVDTLHLLSYRCTGELVGNSPPTWAPSRLIAGALGLTTLGWWLDYGSARRKATDGTLAFHGRCLALRPSDAGPLDHRAGRMVLPPLAGGCSKAANDVSPDRGRSHGVTPPGCANAHPRSRGCILRMLVQRKYGTATYQRACGRQVRHLAAARS